GPPPRALDSPAHAARGCVPPSPCPLPLGGGEGIATSPLLGLAALQVSRRFAYHSATTRTRRGGPHAGDRAQPLLRPGERPREDEGLLLRRARLLGHAATVVPLSRLLARRERQDPGAHGPGRDRQCRALLPRHPEGCGDGPRG